MCCDAYKDEFFGLTHFMTYPLCHLVYVISYVEINDAKLHACTAKPTIMNT